MSGNAAKMVADSTSTEPVKTKKKKKLSGGPKTKKKKTNSAKKAKEKADLLAISNLHDDSDSELDLKKSLKPISGYIKVRSDMLEQMFHSVRGPSLQRTLPDILKDLPIEELKQRCLEQLENMSKKRIRRIIGGDKPENISSSGTEESTDEEEQEDGNLDKQDADSTSQPADAGAESIADIQAVDDEQLLADVASSMTKKKESQTATAAMPNTEGALSLNIAPSLDHSELEILELEMRARAIKAMLRASTQRNQDSAEAGASAEPGAEQPDTPNKDKTQTVEPQLKGKSPAQLNSGQNSPFENAGSKVLGQKASMQIVIGKKAKEVLSAGKRAGETTSEGQNKTEDEELVKLLEEQKKKAALEKTESQPGAEAVQIKKEKIEAESKTAKDTKHRQRSDSRSRSRSYSRSRSRSRSRSDSGSDRRRYRRRDTSDSYSDRSRSDDSRDSRHSRHIRRRRRYRKRRRSSSRSMTYSSDGSSSDEHSDPYRHRQPLQTSRLNPNTAKTNNQFAGPMKRMKWVKKPKKPVPVEDREEGEVSDESEWEQVTDNEQVVIKIEPDDDDMERNRHRLINKIIKREPGTESRRRNKSNPSQTMPQPVRIKVEPEDRDSRLNPNSVTAGGLSEVKTFADDVQIMVPLSTLEYITIESSDSDMDSVVSETSNVASIAPEIASVMAEVSGSIASDVTASIIPNVMTSVLANNIKVEDVSSSVKVPPFSGLDDIVKIEKDSDVSMVSIEDQTLAHDTLLPTTEVIDSTSSESQEDKPNIRSCSIKQETQVVAQSEDLNNQTINVGEAGAVSVPTTCAESEATDQLDSHVSRPDILVESSEEPDSDVITISSTGKGPTSQTDSLKHELGTDLPENSDVLSAVVVEPKQLLADIDMDDGDTIDGLSDIVNTEGEKIVSNTTMHKGSQSDSQQEVIPEPVTGAMSELSKGDHIEKEGVGEGVSRVESGEEDKGAGDVSDDSSGVSEGESDVEVENVSDEESEDIQDWSDLEGRKYKLDGSQIRESEDSQAGSEKLVVEGDSQEKTGVKRDKLDIQTEGELGAAGDSQGGCSVESRGQGHSRSEGDSMVGSQVGLGIEGNKANQAGSKEDGDVVVIDEESVVDDIINDIGADSDSDGHDVDDCRGNSVETKHKTDDTDVDDDNATAPVVTGTAGQTRQRVQSNEDAVMLDDDNEILD